jgi:hypothetical protein
MAGCGLLRETRILLASIGRKGMRIFIAGGSGAIGRFLVPQLVAEGHYVVALTRSSERAAVLESLGAVAVVGDVYDETAVTQAIAACGAELVMHQLTAFGTTDGDPYAETMRIRVDGTRSLVAASRIRRIGVDRLVVRVQVRHVRAPRRLLVCQLRSCSPVVLSLVRREHESETGENRRGSSRHLRDQRDPDPLTISPRTAVTWS